MNKLSTTFLFSFLIFASLNLQAQVTGERILKLPSEYESPNGKISAKSENLTKNEWVVFSDRDDNSTYKSADLKSPILKTMTFMDAFYVIDERGDFLHLVKWDIYKKDGKGKIIAGAVDFGWAPKSNLLLWSSSLVNDKHFTVKALPVLKDKEAFNHPEKYIKNGDGLRLFNAPTLSKENDKAVRMFQFLYIYKRVEGKIMVGKAENFRATSSKESILGWVDESIIQTWDDRVCLEPNWDDNAVDERKDKTIKASLYATVENAQSFKKDGTAAGKVWDDDPYKARKPCQWKRLPILSQDKTTQIISTGFVTDVMDQSSKSVVTVDQQTNTNERFNVVRDNIRKINLIFVIDGGAGMSEHFTSIIKTINQIHATFDGSQSHNTFSYGAVIYRDYADANCADGDKTIKKQQLTANYHDVQDFLEAESKVTGCNDKDVPQAVYKGLQSALRMLADSRNDYQTNYVILIGGPGNYENDTKIKAADVEDLIVTTKANIVAYQVNNGNDNSYTKFVNQMVTIEKESSKKLSLKLRDSKAVGNSIVEPKFTPSTQFENNIYFIDYPKTSALRGSVLFPPKGQSLSPDFLAATLDTLIEDTNSDVERKIDGISSKVEGMGTRDVQLDASLLLYFAALSEKVDQEIVKKYVNTNYQFFIKSYTSVANDKLQNPLFKYVLFTTDQEYDELIRKLRKLDADNGNEQSLREGIKDVYLQLLISYKGEKEAKKTINSMSAEDIVELITGIPSTEKSFLQKYKIADLENRSKVSYDDLKKLVDYFNDKRKMLEGIRSDQQFTFRSNDNNYYWIPQDYLP